MLLILFLSGNFLLVQTLIKQTAEIKEQVLYNTRLLQDMSRRQGRTEKDKACSMPCQLPLKTYEDVMQLEQKLKSKEFYSHLVSFSFKVLVISHGIMHFCLMLCLPKAKKNIPVVPVTRPTLIFVCIIVNKVRFLYTI